MIDINAFRIPYTKLLFTGLLLMIGTLDLTGQGWQSWFYTGNNGPFAKNDVIDALDFIGDRAIFITYQSEGEGLHPAFGKIYDYGVGHQGAFGPEDYGDGISYPPVAGFNNADTTVYVLSDRYNAALGQQSMYMLRYDRNENGSLSINSWYPLYDQPTDYAKGASVIKTEDDHLVALGAVAEDLVANAGNTDVLLVKFDLDGNIIWSNILVAEGGDEAVQVIAADDGGYWILKKNTILTPSPQATSWLVKTDEFGEVISETLLLGTEGDDAREMIQTFDGDFAITGQTETEEIYVLKFDTDGNIIWRQDYISDVYKSQGNGILEDDGQHLVIAGNLTYLADGVINACLVKLQHDGTPLWERDYPRTNSFIADVFNDLVLVPSGGYVMGGTRVANDSVTHGFYVKTDTFGIITGGNISGNVFHDLNLDCTADEEELKLEDWLVTAVSSTRTYTNVTDVDGNYEIPVEVLSGTVGEYTVSIAPPSPYWGACEDDVEVSIPYLEAVEVDFPMEILVECPFLQSETSSFGMIRLCDTTAVVVQYCNNGTAAAEDAYIEVELPDDLQAVDFTITPINITGNIYTFDLGDLPIGLCQTLTIYVTTECDEELLGQSLCINTHIYPDEICEVPGQAWSGALLNASYTCEDGNIQFAIENVGTESMTTELQYVIIEDAVLLMQGNYDLDPAQEAFPDFVPQNGSTYTLLAQQEPGAPGAELLSIGASACPNEGSPVLNEFSQYTGNPFIATYCPIVIGAYDPNDKQAIPAGFGEDHGISANTPINYTIRFQNTGTDTAFRVVIRDTLSPFLDPTTLRPGPSSHPYEFHFEDQALIFRFPNIELPDSNANLVASQGFVSFQINQDDRLPAETRIENRAGIYFDFNSPIITNTVFHTVKEFIDIVSGSVTVAKPDFAVSVAPNPMYDAASIRIEGLPPGLTDLTLELFDATGKAVRSMAGNDQGFWLQRGSLPSGLYFFTISGKEGWLANGKLLVQ